jgi:uncharacterized protein (DUF1697 family)
MPTFISMLRGVNLVSHNRMKMEALRTSLGALGFEQVQTYIQSGNVVFRSQESSAAKLCEKIEKQIFSDFGFTVPVILLTAKEMGVVIKNNPFLTQTGIDSSRLHITFLSQTPAASAVQTLAKLPAGADHFHHSRKAVYLYCPGGYGETKLSNNAFEKLLSVRATTRNWKTVNNLYQMATELE